jgi:hypothetical protein
MLNMESIPRNYEEAVSLLSSWHAESDDPTLIIYALPDSNQEVVTLVEISSKFPATGEIRPIGMGKSADFPYRSQVALTTPEEWQNVKNGRISLPSNWSLEKLVKVWPHDQN